MKPNWKVSSPPPPFPPPPGWEIIGWEYHGDKDANFLLTLYFSPPPWTRALRETTLTIGPEPLPLIDRLDEWENLVSRALENPQPRAWYLTDLRHRHNPTSAEWQGFRPRGEPPH